MNTREKFEMLQNLDYFAFADVSELHCSAAQNASDTVGFANRHDAHGDWTEEFLTVWLGSVSSLLCDCDDANVRAWYEANGFTY